MHAAKSGAKEFSSSKETLLAAVRRKNVHVNKFTPCFPINERRGALNFTFRSWLAIGNLLSPPTVLRDSAYALPSFRRANYKAYTPKLDVSAPRRTSRRSSRGASSFQCRSCTFTAGSLSALRYHEEFFHGGNRPFACDFCEYRAKIRAHLVSHLKTHSVDRPYSCTRCDFTAKRPNHLKLHMVAKHAEPHPMTFSQAYRLWDFSFWQTYASGNSAGWALRFSSSCTPIFASSNFSLLLLYLP